MQQHASVVSVRREGVVAVTVIDNPPVNALSRPVRQGLLDAMRELDADQSVRAIVIAGPQNRFIAGADIREMSLPPNEPFLPDVIAAIEAVGKPVIAAIAGPALGGGLEIALACDLRLDDRERVGWSSGDAARPHSRRRWHATLAPRRRRRARYRVDRRSAHPEGARGRGCPHLRPHHRGRCGGRGGRRRPRHTQAPPLGNARNGFRSIPGRHGCRRRDKARQGRAVGLRGDRHRAGDAE